ncbi:MAG: hypothetical protein ACJ71Z_02425 [Aeromicrobium sp.]
MSMGAETRPPIRILVRGSSTVSWIANVEPGRVAHAYPRELETAMHLDGWPTQVRVESPLAASSRHILRDADADIFAWDPDVIIMNTGHMENLHLLLPIPFARHVFTRTARPGRWRQLYRRRVLWLFYSVATRIQARLEPALGPWLFGRRRKAILAHLNQYIDIASRNGHPLVIVMGFVPPSTPPHTFPGVAARLEIMNEAFRELVAQRAQPEVIWFDPADALASGGVEAVSAIGDGIHFIPAAHVAVGKGLAAVVEAWAAHQRPGLSGSAGRAQLEQEHDVIDAENRPRGVVNE